MIIYPVIGYAFWAVIWYTILNFLCKDHIEKNKLDTTPKSFMNPSSAIGN